MQTLKLLWISCLLACTNAQTTAPVIRATARATSQATTPAARNGPSVVGHAIVPTSTGQIGVNPVPNYETSRTLMPGDAVPTNHYTGPSGKKDIVAPWAVVTQPNGDLIFPLTSDGKATLQKIFDEVVAVCGKAKARRHNSLERRSGACQLNQLGTYAGNGGPLDIVFPRNFNLRIPLFTAGDIQVALNGVAANVGLPLMILASGGIAAFATQSLWLHASDYSNTEQQPTTTTTPTSTTATSTRKVSTTVFDDLVDSVATDGPEKYKSIANYINVEIALNPGYYNSLFGPDPGLIPQATCDKTTITDLEPVVFKNVVHAFCSNVDLGKDRSDDLSNPDPDNKWSGYKDWKFHMDWKAKQGDCQGFRCEDIFNTFASTCAYGGHSMWAKGSNAAGCGTATYELHPAAVVRPDPPPTPTYSVITSGNNQGDVDDATKRVGPVGINSKPIDKNTLQGCLTNLDTSKWLDSGKGDQFDCQGMVQFQSASYAWDSPVDCYNACKNALSKAIDGGMIQGWCNAYAGHGSAAHCWMGLVVPPPPTIDGPGASQSIRTKGYSGIDGKYIDEYAIVDCLKKQDTSGWNGRSATFQCDGSLGFGIYSMNSPMSVPDCFNNLKNCLSSMVTQGANEGSCEWQDWLLQMCRGSMFPR